MIILLKWIWKKMIEIGNTIINTISVGSTTPTRVDVGDTKAWPDTITYFFSISPTYATGLTEQSHSQVQSLIIQQRQVQQTSAVLMKKTKQQKLMVVQLISTMQLLKRLSI